MAGGFFLAILENRMKARAAFAVIEGFRRAIGLQRRMKPFAPFPIGPAIADERLVSERFGWESVRDGSSAPSAF